MSIMRAASDTELLELLKSGSSRAFTALYNRYWEKLYITAYHRLADETEAEEAVQDIFTDLWLRRETLQLTHTLNTYLAAAVKYRIIAALARNKKKLQFAAEQALSGPALRDTTEEWLLEKELQAQILACVDQLPEKCRIVFRLSRELGKSNAEIAAELGIAQKTVEGHMTRALQELRTALQVSAPVLLVLLKKIF
ncbi:RNA polymerase sigma-70 factor [Pedobacter yulinensis]|uniref:RNA polymerase sigma-70 factor n=1 Tax=Pedobacter yulinensis TaxID=2126353 RepID=A0A2T3HPG7_9SPHI|nr:RNA polymerase sigma-70 factor [Pedobacter yulinensis]PST84319.1 RNA polymerase sigma-70 factor [Pedobacter yulinensis]